MSLELPDDLPGRNTLVDTLFPDGETRTALELVDDDRVFYLLPWGTRDDGVAGYEQSMETFRARPREFSPKDVHALMEAHLPRRVSLAATPAWVLAPREPEQPRVSWHARVRWVERIAPVSDPGPCIRRAYAEGVSVGVRQGHGRYYAPENALLTAVNTDADAPLVTTVFQPESLDRFGSDHLDECSNCRRMFDPSASPAPGRGSCQWCGA